MNKHLDLLVDAGLIQDYGSHEGEYWVQAPGVAGAFYMNEKTVTAFTRAALFGAWMALTHPERVDQHQVVRCLNEADVNIEGGKGR